VTQVCAPPASTDILDCFNTTTPKDFGYYGFDRTPLPRSSTDFLNTTIPAATHPGSSGQPQTPDIDLSQWAPATTCPSCAALGLKLTPLKNYQMGTYDTTFSDRKNRVLNACKKIGMSLAHQKVVLAVGMQETKFDPTEIDKSKTGLSDNFSIFNINSDMLNFIGVPCKQCMDSDSDYAIKVAVNAFAKGFQKKKLGRRTFPQFSSGWKGRVFG